MTSVQRQLDRGLSGGLSLVLVFAVASAEATPVRVAQPEAAPSSQPASSQPTSQPATQSDLRQLRGELSNLREQVKRLKQSQRQTRDRLEETEALVDARDEDKPAERKYSIYGFFDVSYQKIASSGSLTKVLSDAENTFLFGNLNTYFDYHPLASWRFLAEVRFLLNPIGETRQLGNPLTGDRYERAPTRTQEAAFPLDRFDLGSVEIERALATWSRFEWLTISAGLFLTPYGIWNVDHGSPTRLQAGTPLLYALGPDNPFPERQLGLWIHGSFLVGDLELVYDVTLSNGRGPKETLEDSNEDKAVGGRLALADHAGALKWKLGASVYTGLNTDFDKRFDPKSGDLLTVFTSGFRETALGVDLALSTSSWGLQGEVLANWRSYREGQRPPATRFFGLFPEEGFAADRLFWGAYGLLWYRLPLSMVSLRPYAAVYWIDPDDNFDTDEALAITAGLNWRIRGAVVLKAEYGLADSDVGRIHQLLTQLAVAF